MAVTVNIYDHFPEILGDGTLDMDNDNFKIALMDSGHTFNAANTAWANVSANEIANGNGYTSGGVLVANVIWAQTSGVIKFAFDNPSWTASGGSIANVTDAVLYDDTHASDLLICSIDFGETKTAEDGADLTISLAAAGLITIG